MMISGVRAAAQAGLRSGLGRAFEMPLERFCMWSSQCAGAAAFGAAGRRWARGGSCSGLRGKHGEHCGPARVSLRFQKPIQGPGNASIARFDGLGRYQKRRHF